MKQPSHLFALIFLFAAVGPLTAVSGQKPTDPFKQHLQLMYEAILDGNADRVDRLLKTPYVAVSDKFSGQTFLSIAVNRRRQEVIDVLLKNGADITAKNDNGANVVNVWSQNPYLDIFKFLLPRVKTHFGPDKQNLKVFINNVGGYGRTPIVTAMVQSMRLEMTDDEMLFIAKTFVESGADVNPIDTSGFTTLDYAKCYRPMGVTADRTKTSEYLSQHGAVCAKKPNH